MTSVPALTAIGVRALPPGGTLTVAVAGLKLSPAAPVACQVTVAGRAPSALSTTTSTVDDPPGTSPT